MTNKDYLQLFVFKLVSGILTFAAFMILHKYSTSNNLGGSVFISLSAILITLNRTGKFLGSFPFLDKQLKVNRIFSLYSGLLLVVYFLTENFAAPVLLTVQFFEGFLSAKTNIHYRTQLTSQKNPNTSLFAVIASASLGVGVVLYGLLDSYSNEYVFGTVFLFLNICGYVIFSHHSEESAITSEEAKKNEQHVTKSFGKTRKFDKAIVLVLGTICVSAIDSIFNGTTISVLIDTYSLNTFQLSLIQIFLILGALMPLLPIFKRFTLIKNSLIGWIVSQVFSLALLFSLAHLSLSGIFGILILLGLINTFEVSTLLRYISESHPVAEHAFLHRLIEVVTISGGFVVSGLYFLVDSSNFVFSAIAIAILVWIAVSLFWKVSKDA